MVKNSAVKLSTDTTLNGVKMKKLKSFKYLGIVIHEKLKFENYITSSEKASTVGFL